MIPTLQTGRLQRPPRCVVHGAEGVGKTHLAAAAPAPVFILTEDGLGNLDVAAFPVAATYADVIGHLSTLFSESHEFQTVVLDSADWLEGLIWSHVAREKRVANIDSLPYGQGYSLATACLREVLDGLDALRRHRGMTPVVTAHSAVKRFDDPMHGSYERHVLKLHHRAASLLCEWADIVGFASFDLVVRHDDAGFGKRTTRAISVGERVLHLTGSPSCVAKNRFGLPAVIPLQWDSLAAALEQAMKKETDL